MITGFIISLLFLYYLSQNEETKANYAERVIKTLKTMLYRYFTKHRTYKYKNVLQDFVKTYNTTPHRSLGNIPPKDVNKQNEARLFAYQYLRKKPVRRTTKRLKRLKPTRFRLKIGDLVRISYTKRPFQRVYQQQWSSEIFKIDKRTLSQGIPQYKLVDFHDEAITGNFYESELQR